MTTESELNALAGRLTKAQQDAIMCPHWHGAGEPQIALVEGKIGLPATFAHMFTLRWDKLTPRALAVREHLIALWGKKS